MPAGFPNVHPCSHELVENIREEKENAGIYWTSFVRASWVLRIQPLLKGDQNQTTQHVFVIPNLYQDYMYPDAHWVQHIELFAKYLRLNKT